MSCSVFLILTGNSRWMDVRVARKLTRALALVYKGACVRNLPRTRLCVHDRVAALLAYVNTEVPQTRASPRIVTIIRASSKHSALSLGTFYTAGGHGIMNNVQYRSMH